MARNYTIVFEGVINKTFKFSEHISVEPSDWIRGEGTDLSKHVCLKQDGYLYIEGCRITNNPDSIKVIVRNLSDGGHGYNTGVSYIDSTFVIDRSGLVICKKHQYSSNKLDRLFNKLLG